MIDGNNAESRSATTADDIVGPLDILFEFGSLRSAYPADSSLQPAVFFGPDSAFVGLTPTTSVAFPKDWKQRRLENHLHCVFEGCEASTGMRSACCCQVLC